MESSNEKPRFAETVAWITGGSTGIGRATALQFAREGARVAVLSRSPEDLTEVVNEIQQKGGQAMAVTANVRDAAAMQRAVRSILDQWGRLDYAVANAGINGIWAPITELTPDQWNDTLEVNLRGTFLTLKYAGQALEENSASGAMVVVSSVNGTRMFSNVGASAYASSKAAQMALAKMAALEFAEKKIRVNVICPGWIETEIETERHHTKEAAPPVEFPEGVVPLTEGKPGSAEQVAELICWLCSPAASHITGTEVFIDGGQSLLQG